MQNKIEVELVLNGSTVKAKIDKESYTWAKTPKRSIIMNKLKAKNIGFSSLMSTGGLIRLLERHKDKTYAPLSSGGYRDHYRTGMVKACPICGNDFKLRHYNQKNCSKECANKSASIRMKEKHRMRALLNV